MSLVFFNVYVIGIICSNDDDDFSQVYHTLSSSLTTAVTSHNLTHSHLE